MRCFLIALLFFMETFGSRSGRWTVDAPRERLFLDLHLPVTETWAATAAVGLPSRPSDTREKEPRGLLISVGVRLYL